MTTTLAPAEDVAQWMLRDLLDSPDIPTIRAHLIHVIEESRAEAFLWDMTRLSIVPDLDLIRKNFPKWSAGLGISIGTMEIVARKMGFKNG